MSFDIKSKRFVVLDRDGTLIAEKHYLSDPNLVELIAGAAQAIKEFRDLGLGVVIITNQSGIGRGYLDLKRLEEIHYRLRELLWSEGASIDSVYFCPHLPSDNCACRKPNPNLLFQAAEEWNFRVADCFVIGDSASDIELGSRLGATTILVRTGYGRSVEEESVVEPDVVIDSIEVAPSVIRNILIGKNEG